jgi:hypothetical protein
MKNLIKVSRTTRASIKGKLIFCPHCFSSYKVYHFAWSFFRCPNEECNKLNDKNEGLVEIK